MVVENEVGFERKVLQQSQNEMEMEMEIEKIHFPPTISET